MKTITTKSFHVLAFSRNYTLWKTQYHKVLVMTTTLQIHWMSSEDECKWKIRRCYTRRINFHVLQITLRKLIWVCYYPFMFAKIFFFEFVSVCVWSRNICVVNLYRWTGCCHIWSQGVSAYAHTSILRLQSSDKMFDIWSDLVYN